VTSVPRVYLDTNVFIAAYEHVSARSDHARWVLDAVEDGRIHGATSEITLAELLVKPFQEEALAIIDAYLAVIQPGAGFDVMPIERAVLIEAARVRASRLSIRLPAGQPDHDGQRNDGMSPYAPEHGHLLGNSARKAGFAPLAHAVLPVAKTLA